VLAKQVRALGNPEARYAQRTERYVLQTNDVRLISNFSVRNDDFRVATTIDGSVYEQGRHEGLRWRRTPAGLVRIIESDIQGDDLDRWPLALLPVHAADCALVGETTGSSPAWVVEYRPAHEYPHWFYVDQTSGLITREVMRDGSRVNTIVFDDFRPIAGTQRPYHWRVTGAGGPLGVSLDDLEFAPIAPAALEIPPSNTHLTALPPAQPVALPASFGPQEIMLRTAVDGKVFDFLLDTGTTQIILDDAAARRLGIRSTLGHALVKELTVGPARIENASVLTVNLGGFGVGGILGYDFFAGHVVHIDYRHQRVELIDRSAFLPPATAWVLDAWCGEGLPLITLPFGDAVGQRFALDTGSPNLLLLQYLSDHDGIRLGDIGLGRPFGQGTMRFLEGLIATDHASLRSIRIGRVTFRDFPVMIERVNAGDAIEIPLDGIIGTRILNRFEWWFDYDGGRLWFQPT